MVTVGLNGTSQSDSGATQQIACSYDLVLESNEGLAAMVLETLSGAFNYLNWR